MTLKQRIGRLFFRNLPITRFLFDQIRVELNAVMVRTRNAVLPSRRRRSRELRKGRNLLVNVACGPHVVPGFVNMDLMPCCTEVIAWDCRRRLPFADGGASGVRAEHFVEHLETREELPAFLKECRRVLKSGGILRVIVPDAERYLQAYLRKDLSGFLELNVPDPFPADLATRMDIVNHVFHQWSEHRWGYDFETLAHRLRAAGFSRIETAEYRKSLDPRLACDLDTHAPYSLYVDAER